jgi:hypothetical protein
VGIHSSHSQDLASDVMKEKKFGSVANSSVQFAVHKHTLFMNNQDDDTIQDTDGNNPHADTVRDTFDDRGEVQSNGTKRES